MTRVLTPPTPFRFSRDLYYRMAEAGIISPNDRVELLDGEVFKLSPIGPMHGGVLNRLNAFFAPRVVGRAICSVQLPIVLHDYSEPEPDLALLKPRADFYTTSHATAGDVLLVIEVADSSREYDLGPKARAYAGAGIPEYWIFDLLRAVLIVHRDPVDGEYTTVEEFDGTASISPIAFPDLVLNVGTILS